jgi:hypothetical protein
MLADSQTERHTVLRPHGGEALTKAQARAFRKAIGNSTTQLQIEQGSYQHAFPEAEFARTLEKTCVQVQPSTIVGLPTQSGTGDVLSLGLASHVDVEQAARCLHRHGLLSDTGLASIIDERTVRHGLGRVVPLSAQVVPSTMPLTLWSILLAAEIIGAFLLIRHVRRVPGT